MAYTNIKSKFIKELIQGRSYEHSGYIDKLINIERTILNGGPTGWASAVCFHHRKSEYPAEYEIVAKGRKIVGSAQKRGKRALLQQGSIFVSNIDNGAYSVLRNSYEEQNAVSIEAVLGRKVSFEELSKVLTKGFEEKLGIEFSE